ncbi:MAG: RNA ligase, partial [Thermodesulfovibrionales bacterium]
FVEEKMDGYNVRIARIKDWVIAFTRGGFICPFTTDRIPDLIDHRFFDRYPDYILCGEVVGPGSPYNTEVIPYVKEDVVFFIFDIIKKDGSILLPEERYESLKDFNMNLVDRWGPFEASDIERIKGIVLDLDRREREGIVIKPLGSGKALKYVTLSSCLRDLKATTHLISEIPAGFYMQRIMRALFFSYEFGISLNDDYLMEASRALYLKPYEAIKDVAEGGEIKESFIVRIRKRETATELLRHLNRSGVYTQLLSIEKAGEYYNLRFNRIYRKGTKEIRQLLKGKGFFD